MDRYLVTAWARKLVLVLFCVVALIWGIRQATLTYHMWFADQANMKKKIITGVPAIPESTKAVGEQFLEQYYDTEKDEIWEQKSKRLADFVTNYVQNQWVRTPSLILLSEKVDAEKIVRWNDKWLEVGKKALVEYQVTLEDKRKMQLRILVVKSGNTWLVDSLPSLLPQPTRSIETVDTHANVSEEERNKMEQAADGFFDSWLKGRVDANTKTLNKPPINLLQIVDGEYQAVLIEPVKTKPWVVNATVFIESKSESDSDVKQTFPFQYLLELVKNKDQYVVKRMIGG